MKILFVAATHGEVDFFLQYLGIHHCDSNHYKVAFKNRQIEVLLTGAGMVHTAFHLGRLLLNNTYDWVINVGIGGSFDKKLKIGQIVQIQSQVFGDVGAENGSEFIPLANMAFFDENQFPYKNGYLLNPSNISIPLLKSLEVASAITVNRVTGSESSLQLLKKTFQPQVESMEGAAFFYACLMSQQKFVELRAISNYVEVRNPSNWNIPLAVKNLNQFLVELLNS